MEDTNLRYEYLKTAELLATGTFAEQDRAVIDMRNLRAGMFHAGPDLRGAVEGLAGRQASAGDSQEQPLASPGPLLGEEDEMTAVGIKVGDHVKVETKTFEGRVESYVWTQIVSGGPTEMVVCDDQGHELVFNPNDPEVTVTKIQPPFRSGQVWETPDGMWWFIRRAEANDFCAIPIGDRLACYVQADFLAKLPQLVFPVKP